MRLWRWTIELLSPVSLPRVRMSNHAESRTEIPGRTLRGALAAAWIRRHGKDEGFHRLFTSDSPLIVPMCAPGNPRPMTVYACKRNSSGAHGFFDRSITLIRQMDSGKREDTEWLCPVCGNDLVPASGMELDGKQVSIPRIFRTHAGIEYGRGSVAPGVLYSVQAISHVDLEGRPVRMHGLTEAQKDLEDLVQDLMRLPLYVGSDRSRGYGEVRLSVEAFDRDEQTEAQRVANFSRQFARRLGVDPDERSYVAVMAEEPVVLVDAMLRPTDVLETPVEGAKAVLKVNRAERLRGWHMAAGLPAFDDQGLLPGAVWVFAWNRSLLDEEWLALARWSMCRVGADGHLGYGRISLSPECMTGGGT